MREWISGDPKINNTSQRSLTIFFFIFFLIIVCPFEAESYVNLMRKKK